MFTHSIFFLEEARTFCLQDEAELSLYGAELSANRKCETHNFYCYADNLKTDLLGIHSEFFQCISLCMCNTKFCKMKKKRKKLKKFLENTAQDFLLCFLFAIAA